MKSWTTLQGEKLLIKDMSTRHIENCIAMLKRNKPDFLSEAEAAAEHGFNLTASIFQEGEEKWQDAIDSFKRELKRREKTATK